MVANRFINDGITRETVDWSALGNLRGWSRRWHAKLVEKGMRGVTGLSPRRRARVWLWAVRLPVVQWHGDRWHGLQWAWESAGLVTGWVEGLLPHAGMADGRAAGRYGIVGENGEDGLAALDALPEGEYIVFTAVEVAEKRGRHWVRLPWACKLRAWGAVSLLGLPEAACAAPEAWRRSWRLVPSADAVAARLAVWGRCRALGRFEDWAALGAGRDAPEGEMWASGVAMLPSFLYGQGSTCPYKKDRAGASARGGEGEWARAGP